MNANGTRIMGAVIFLVYIPYKRYIPTCAFHFISHNVSEASGFAARNVLVL